MIRKSLRRIIRSILKSSPVCLKKIASRVPFSRFSKVAGWLFCGEEIVKWRGVLVKVNPGNIHEFCTYFLGAYSETQIDKLIELCRQSRIFVDVGANTGMFSLAVSCACPGLEVFAFEPDRHAAEKFRINLNLNSGLSERLHFIEKAIADTDSDSYFHSSDDTADIELGRITPHRVSAADYMVSLMRLDKFFDSLGRYPDVVNIDTEGAELRVLQGMQGLFCKGFPMAMLIETHPFYSLENNAAFKKEINTVAQKFAYNLFWLDRQSWRLLSFSDDWSRPMQILAIKNSGGTL